MFYPDLQFSRRFHEALNFNFLQLSLQQIHPRPPNANTDDTMKFIGAILFLFAAAASAQSCTGNEIQVCQGNSIKFCNLAKNNVFDVSGEYFFLATSAGDRHGITDSYDSSWTAVAKSASMLLAVPTVSKYKREVLGKIGTRNENRIPYFDHYCLQDPATSRKLYNELSNLLHWSWSTVS